MNSCQYSVALSPDARPAPVCASSTSCTPAARSRPWRTRCATRRRRSPSSSRCSSARPACRCSRRPGAASGSPTRRSCSPATRARCSSRPTARRPRSPPRRPATRRGACGSRRSSPSRCASAAPALRTLARDGARPARRAGRGRARAGAARARARRPRPGARRRVAAPAARAHRGARAPRPAPRPGPRPPPRVASAGGARPASCRSRRSRARRGSPGTRDTGWEELVLRSCRELGGYDPDIRHRANDSVLALGLVEAGLAVTLLPGLVAPAGRPGDRGARDRRARRAPHDLRRDARGRRGPARRCAAVRAAIDAEAAALGWSVSRRPAGGLTTSRSATGVRT